MRFLMTKSLDYIGVAEIRRIVPNRGGGWSLLGEDNEVLGKMGAEFWPESLNESYVAAAAGSTCLIVCNDRDTGEVFAEPQPVVAWRISRERESPAAEPVTIEPIPSNAVIVAVPMPDGSWCEPDVQIHANLDALMAEARQRIRPAAGVADPPAHPQQETIA